MTVYGTLETQQKALAEYRRSVGERRERRVLSTFDQAFEEMDGDLLGTAFYLVIERFWPDMTRIFADHWPDLPPEEPGWRY
jgi:hypothetical protein